MDQIKLEYLVVSTGHTNRLLHPTRLELLRDFCLDLGIIPLFIHDENCMSFLSSRDGSIYHDIKPYEYDTCYALAQSLSKHNVLLRGVIVFRVATFENISKVLCHIDSLDHCKFGPLRDLKLLESDVMYAYYDTQPLS